MGRPICVLETWMPSVCGAIFQLTDPILHLPMNDDAPNPKVYDKREIYNQIFLDPTGDPNTDAHTIAGHIDKALNFDGVDDCIVLTEAATVRYLDEWQDCTVAWWWKSDIIVTDPASHIVSSFDWSYSGFSLNTNPTGIHFRVRCDVGLGEHMIVWDTACAHDNAWHHWALVREGLTVRMYLDGSLGLTDTDPSNYAALASSNNQVVIGRQANSTKWSPGDGEDFRIYNRALTTAEVLVLANM